MPVHDKQSKWHSQNVKMYTGHQWVVKSIDICLTLELNISSVTNNITIAILFILANCHFRACPRETEANNQ